MPIAVGIASTGPPIAAPSGAAALASLAALATAAGFACVTALYKDPSTAVALAGIAVPGGAVVTMPSGEVIVMLLSGPAGRRGAS